MVDLRASPLSRIPPLAGRQFSAATVKLTPATPAFRLSLRAPAESLVAIGEALGLQLPMKPKTSASSGTRSALWLGPDEWLLIDEGDADPALALRAETALHSAVDVSHRNTAILVSGPGAEATLSAGCPQDLALKRFPVGACSRTVLGKVEIVLWRTGEQDFRVECWRSFSDYAFSFLEDAARDPGR